MPLWIGEYLRMPCRYSEMKTAMHMMMAPASRIATSAATRLWLANRLNGRMGLSA